MGLFDIFKNEKKQEQPAGTAQKTAGPVEIPSGIRYPDKDNALIYDGLHLTEILYHYGRIVAKYSPTGRDDHFGQFELMFDSGSAYTEDMLEAVAMQVYVNGGKVVKVGG